MGQTTSGKQGGILKGKKHSECDDDGCGIKAVVDGTKTVELQGGEVIINAEAMTDPEVMTVTGTKKEIASKINSDKGYGVKFEEGGEVKPSFKTGGVLPNRIYLGEEGGSEISGKSVFEKAVQLEKQGKSNEQIRQLTGWFRNPHDKLWRFEISDKEFVLNNSEIERIKARIKSTGKPEKFTFEDIARHDILFTAYPEAKKLSVIFENDKSKPQSSFSNNTITYNFNYELEKEHTTTGSSDNGKDRVFRSAILRERRSAFAHELTHYVQIREGHGRGSSAVWEFGKLLKEQQSLGREVGESEKADLVLKSNTLYWSSSGEIEARDVQRRIEMTDEELRKNEPLKTIDRSGEPTVRIGKKMKSGGEVSDEMENFDWNSLYEGVNDNDTEKESSKQPKYDIEKIKSLIDQKIDDEKAIIEDWSSRDYKSNKGIVYTGGDDIHGTPLQIGSINESRRRNKINSAERVISELSLAKDIVEKYRGNESDLYNIVLDDYRKNYYRGYKPSSHKRDYKAEQRYSDAYDLLINTVKESETFKSGGEVNKETKMDNQIEYRGYYITKVKISGNDYFQVQSNENKSKGIKRGMGDALESDLESAKKTVDQQIEKLEYDKQREQEIKEQQAVESVKKEEKSKKIAGTKDLVFSSDKLSIYIDKTGLTPIQSGRLNDQLDKKWLDSDRTTYTIRERLSKGEYVDKKENKGGKFNRAYYNSLSSTEAQNEYEKRLDAKKSYDLITKDDKYIEVPKVIYDALIFDKKEGSSNNPDELILKVTDEDVDNFYELGKKAKFKKSDWDELGNPESWSNEEVKDYIDTELGYYFGDAEYLSGQEYEDWLTELKTKAGKRFYEKMSELNKSEQLSKGTKVELEHKDTIEEIASGKLSPEEGAKEIAKDHIAEDPAYYDKLEKVEQKPEPQKVSVRKYKDSMHSDSYDFNRMKQTYSYEVILENGSKHYVNAIDKQEAIQLANKEKNTIFTKDEPKKEFYELTYPEFAKSISLYPNQIDKTLDVSYQNEDGSSTMLPLRINGVNENVANEYNRLQLEKFHLREVKKAIADGIIVPKKVIDFYKSLDSLLQERYGVYFNEEKETEMNIEESEENVMLPYKNYKGQINPKSIVIKPQDGTKGRVFRSWHQANDALRYIIDQQKYSDAIYEVEFQDGETLDGTIDLEPKSFWDGKNNPLTWHLNTFWGNVSKASASPIMSQEGIDFAKKLVSDYNIGQNIPNSNIETEIEPEMPAETSISPERMKILESVMKSMSKEKKTAYNYVYDRLMKVAPDLMSLLEQAEYPSDVYGKSQYRTDDFGGNDAFMYLAIEGLEKDSAGRYVLSISHYYKQQGDMMCDPCMTVRLDTELKTVEALTFKMDGIIGRGIIKEVYGLTKDGKEGVNLSEKKSQNSFLNTWSSNWVKQGHKVEFRPLPEKEASGTPISEEAQAIIQPEWDKMQDFLAGKEAKALERKSENEIKREKYPVVVEWSEGSSDENIGFENLEQLEIWLDQIGFTDDPDNTYIKNRVWFRGMTSYVRIDLSKQKGDFNPKEQSLIEYLIENVSKQFDWQSLSEGKTPIVQDANFTYFKGIEANYDNQFKLNKAIEEFLDSKTDDYVYATEEKEFISTYEGYGGLEKQGATGVGLLFEYYTPPKLIEKMWGLAYKYGFSTGKVLEPSVGIGRFVNYTSKNDIVKGYEISPYSAKICRIIHPKASIIQSSFAEHFYKGNVFNPKFEKDFDLVIGNPPYGKMTDLRTYGENSRIGVSISQYEHYFILRGLDCLKSGGLLIYVSTANLATKGYEKIKEKIIEKSDLVDCYLLPNTTFKQTKVNTSLIVLRRK